LFAYYCISNGFKILCNRKAQTILPISSKDDFGHRYSDELTLTFALQELLQQNAVIIKHNVISTTLKKHDEILEETFA
jgi:hypothetical protein